MTQQRIRADEVRVGDLVWDSNHYSPNKWQPVKGVTRIGPDKQYVMIDLGYITVGRLDKEVIMVDRTTFPCEGPCQCEHSCHFTRTEHVYGAVRELTPMMTEMGVFKLCAQCQKECHPTATKEASEAPSS